MSAEILENLQEGLLPGCPRYPVTRMVETRSSQAQHDVVLTRRKGKVAGFHFLSETIVPRFLGATPEPWEN